MLSVGIGQETADWLVPIPLAILMLFGALPLLTFLIQISCRNRILAGGEGEGKHPHRQTRDLTGVLLLQRRPSPLCEPTWAPSSTWRRDRAVSGSINSNIVARIVGSPRHCSSSPQLTSTDRPLRQACRLRSSCRRRASVQTGPSSAGCCSRPVVRRRAARTWGSVQQADLRIACGRREHAALVPWLDRRALWKRRRAGPIRQQSVQAAAAFGAVIGASSPPPWALARPTVNAALARIGSIGAIVSYINYHHLHHGVLGAGRPGEIRAFYGAASISAGVVPDTSASNGPGLRIQLRQNIGCGRGVTTSGGDEATRRRLARGLHGNDGGLSDWAGADLFCAGN